MKHCFTFLFLALTVCFSHAQTAQDSLIYGVNFASGDLRFAKANIQSGVVNILNSTPTSQDQFGSGVSDMDPLTGTYYYVRAGKIYAVDSTGTVLQSPTITCATDPLMATLPITNIAYNWLNNTLYGLHHYGSSLQFAKVDPLTGVMTIISQGVISPDLYSSGVSDIDPFSNQYFYIRDNRIVTVDLTTGAILGDFALTNPNGAIQPITNIAYNYITDQIYGLNFKGGQPAELRLASVNRYNGTVTLISQSPLSQDIFQSGVSDINPALNVYTYVRGVFASVELISVDLSTGLIAHSPTMSNPNNAVSPLTNIAYRKAVEIVPVPEATFEHASDGLILSFRDISRFGRNFSWDFGDGNSHTDQHPQHTYAAPGTYTVTLQVDNDKGTHTYSQDVTVEGATSLDRDLNDIDFQLYPNPSQGLVTLDAPAGVVSVLDLQGKLIYSTVKEQDGKLQIATEQWPQGMYQLRLQTTEGTVTRKLVNQ